MAQERDDLVYLAKLAEQAERFDEMVERRRWTHMAYKNVIGSRRASWRVISSIEQKSETAKASLIVAYKKKIETELETICGDILRPTPPTPPRRPRRRTRRSATSESLSPLSPPKNLYQTDGGCRGDSVWWGAGRRSVEVSQVARRPSSKQSNKGKEQKSENRTLRVEQRRRGRRDGRRLRPRAGLEVRVRQRHARVGQPEGPR